MAAAALRPMMAVAREEAAIVASEASVAARTTMTSEAAAAVRGAGHEVLNPVAVREAAEASAKRAVDMTGESRARARGWWAPRHRAVGTPTVSLIRIRRPARQCQAKAPTKLAQLQLTPAESNIIGILGHAKPPPTPHTPTLSTSTSTVGNTLLAEAGTEATTLTSSTTASTTTTLETTVGQLLEQDMGVTIKEAMTNGAETGAQDLAEQAQEMAKNILNGDVQLNRKVNNAMRAAAQPT